MFFISLRRSAEYFKKLCNFPPFRLKFGSSGRRGWKGSLKKLCKVLPPALMAAMPVGANTTYFFFVCWQMYFKNVDLPVPAFPVRNTDWRVYWMSFNAF